MPSIINQFYINVPIFVHVCYFSAAKSKKRWMGNTDTIPANIYLFKVNNRNTRKRCEIYLKLTIKTSQQCHWHRSGVFIVNFEHISYLFLVFLFLTFNMYLFAGIIIKHPRINFFPYKLKVGNQVFGTIQKSSAKQPKKTFVQ